MKMKTVIRIIDAFNTIIIAALIFLVIAIAFSAKDGTAFIIEALCFLPFFTAFLFRWNIINLYLKKCKYPVPFLSVLKKLKLLGGLDIEWSEDDEKNFIRPTYSTEAFVNDNNLKTHIGVLGYFGRDPGPVMRFTSQNLQIKDTHITWSAITDWDFIAGGEDTEDKMVITEDRSGNMHETIIAIAKLDIGKVELLLLMAHFKAKYS